MKLRFSPRQTDVCGRVTALKVTHLEARFCHSRRPSLRLEAKVGHEVSAFVSDGVATFRALESRLGSFIPERRGSLVIRFVAIRIPRSPPPALRKCTHPLLFPPMLLPRHLFAH